MTSIFSFGLKSALNNGLFQIGLWALQAKLMRDAGQSDVAAFGVGAQFYNVMIFLPTTIGPLLLRAIAGELPERKRRTVGVAIFSCILACLLALVGYELFKPLMFSLLPKLYGRSEAVVFWSILAGAVLFVKAPVSIYFQAKFVVLPEGASTTAAALLLIAVSVFGGLDASHAAMWRFVSHAVQAIVIFAFFLLERRRSETAKFAS
jgi:O-antigen/teichoic acid export membrane protein